MERSVPQKQPFAHLLSELFPGQIFHNSPLKRQPAPAVESTILVGAAFRGIGNFAQLPLFRVVSRSFELSFCTTRSSKRTYIWPRMVQPTDGRGESETRRGLDGKSEKETDIAREDDLGMKVYIGATPCDVKCRYRGSSNPGKQEVKNGETVKHRRVERGVKGWGGTEEARRGL